MILEVGCGGVYSAFSPRVRGEDVIYIDVGKPSVKIPNFIRADADFMPLGSSHFKEI